MSKLYVPEGYRDTLDIRTTDKAIKYVKDNFENIFARHLGLERITAPLFVTDKSGLNDNLNGTERPVAFDIPDAHSYVQVVHSLAKWKRLALKRYGFSAGEGIYTDMNAIRRDEELDNLHSVYVDQWDWEKVILKEDRTLAYLKKTVKKICENWGEKIEYKGEVYYTFPTPKAIKNATLEEIQGTGASFRSKYNRFIEIFPLR